MKSRKNLFLVLGFGILFCGSLFSGSAYADNATITKKWLLSQFVKQCASLENETITPQTGGNKVIDSVLSSDKSGLLLPSYGFDSLPTSPTTCKKLLGGSGNLSSILGSAKDTKWNSGAGAAEKLLVDTFKYDTETENGGGTFQIVATTKTCTATYGLFINTTDCDNDANYSESETRSTIITASKNSDGGLTYSKDNESLFSSMSVTLGNGKITVKVAPTWLCYGDTLEVSSTLYVNMQKTYNELRQNLGNKAAKISCTTGSEGVSTTITTKYSFNVDSLVENSDNVTKYKRGQYHRIVSALNGGTQTTKFSNNEIYDLYYYYLNKTLPNSGQNYRMTCESVSSTAGLTAVKLVSGGVVKNCYVNFNGTNPGSLSANIIDDNGYYPTFKTGSIQDVIDWLNNNLTVGETMEGAESVVDSGDDNNNGDDDTSDPCYNGDLESMGWILCPTESNLQEVGDGLMGWIDDFLEVDTSYYDNNSAAYQVWEIARNIANVFMIIVLLVIIFSQLTGVGINNYGIKKALPRLIMMAILINLSFIICQVAIDLSNILGEGLNHLLHSIAEGIDSSGRIDLSLTDIAGGFIAAAAAGAAASAGIYEAVTLVSGNGSGGGVGIVVIIIIVVLLIVLVAVLMFFAALALRMMIVILFTAISPLAFACYVLPNTQKLFKSWWNVFKAALLVFPICGGLYGLSFIIRAIAFSGESVSFPMAMIGLIASVMPFLVLPSLTKKAISGLGIVGEKFNGIGRSLTGGLRRGLSTAKGTEAYKNRMDAGRANMNERAIRRLENRQKNDKLSDYQQRELGRRRMISEQTAAKRGEYEKYGSGEYSAADISEAARQNAYTGTGSKVNQSLGESDATKAYEGASGVLAETSRLAAAQGAAGQLGKTIAGNRAAEAFKAENAARISLASKAVAQVELAARGGTLSKITQANGYTAEQENLAKQLMSKTGNSLVGKTTADFLKAVRSDEQLHTAAVNASGFSALAKNDQALANTGMRTDQVQKNIGTSTTTALNQLENATAVDEAGVAQVNREIALQRAQASRVAQERKTWSDQLSRAGSSEISAALAQGLQSNNVAQIGAAFEALKDTGNLPAIHAALNNPDLWKNMTKEVRLELDQDMIKSGDVGMKLFAKLDFGVQNGNFAEFLSGTGDSSMGAKIAAKGSHALDGQDKDTIDFLAEHIDGLFGSGDTNAGSLAKQIISGYNATQDGNEKSKFLKMLDAFKNHGDNKYADTTAEFESAFSGAISAAALAKMDSKMIEALGPNKKTILSKQIAELKQPNNATLLASMSQSVKDKLGL